ncbi:MAG: hypothetical protein A3C02_03830 [Candidatus Andersenbacteria bacterium RIFCSPHIGHO2_02_FULL_45_11]|uniref:Nudix hydrolase domain-containing protein n=1 Tax=Candidatus Andersenbacteria bacterium RIFCSPHIGHO2_12_FULL_45_11 TaxID=1797281 RepID=A0A1G1X3A6_9BACT|nr:MAG: hypothetical protein A3C02_03830 [Candidatus Andersenbacteria bacterium RIFCSPHIGHO2_02_FULL_45_11]OGY34495.1 MAG: hypothetical protein A3D99_03300 [Candidatus Andersenbacteria bacterium RIFCSPHIGHO2_12_FULL_45_11]
MSEESWQLVSRKNLVKSPFLNVFEDTVRLPNGKVIDDYTVVKKPDIVIIIATTSDNKILIFQEYKYAVDKMLNTVPAGHVEEGEEPLATAKRELLEETGYTSDEFALCQTLCEYPTKDIHKVYIVSAKNIRLVSEQSLEDTEGIGDMRLISPQDLQREIGEGKWTITAVLAAFAIVGILKSK